MAITIRWDQVQGSERRIAVRESGYDVRCGIVFGLTEALTTPYQALTKAILSSDDPPTYEHPDPALSAQGYVLWDVIARGESQTTARIWARYQPASFSGAPIESLSIEGRSSELFEQFERHPLTGQPFTVALPSDPPEEEPSVSSHDPNAPTVNVAGLGYSQSPLAITLYGLYANVPPQLHALGKKVNHAAWPPASVAATSVGLASRPKGHWLATPLDWRWSKRDGRYWVNFTLLSKGDQPGEDWSSYAFATSSVTGKKLAPSQSLMNALLAQEYDVGVRNNNGGVIKVGFYDLANYSAVLGPMLNNTPFGNTNPFGFS